MTLRCNKIVITHSLAFSVIFILILILTSIALNRINQDLQNIKAIVNENNLKTQLVNQMHTAARDRTVALMLMVIETDSFVRDEAYLKFNRSGGYFIGARKRLLAMKLSTIEKTLLDKQAKLTTEKVVPLQREISEKAILEELDIAHDLLLYQAIPQQNEVFKILKQLQMFQENSAGKFLQETEASFHSTRSIILALAFLIIFIGLIVAIFLIRRTVLSEDNLTTEKERAIITLHSIEDGVITTDIFGNVETLNNVAQNLTGWPIETAKSMPIQKVCQFYRDSDHVLIENPVLLSLKKAQVIQSRSNKLLIRNDGSEYAIEFTASPIFDKLKNLTGSILVFRDVTEMRALTHKLSYQATHDSLTSLINRREFEKRLKNAIETAANHNENHILCYLDLDQFKLVNDTCGHIAGDELLKLIAITLKTHIRESDIIARLGGDEFGILLRNCSLTKAHKILENTRKAINDIRFVWDEKTFNIGLSVGVVKVNEHSGNIYNVLSAADSSCYVAKDEGRNRVHVFEQNDDILIKRQGEMQWVHKINFALENNKFRLYYQTIEPTNTDNLLLHYEILIRMIGEDGKIIPPMAYIPAAERYDLMTTIDRWVVHQTLQSLQFIDKNRFGIIAINISAQSLSDDNFLEFITNEISLNNINPTQLCFEITETSAIINLSRAIEFISSLKNLGCRFALDDFGSGLSSFAYLKNLPVDYLKIDGGFIRDIIDDPMDCAFVESINQIGHVMGIKTIAEFVENKKIHELIKKIGIDYSQGFYLSKPKPLSDLMHKKFKSQVV